MPVPVDLTATYALGRAGNTPARSFLLDLGGQKAAGFSPETVVEVSAYGQVAAHPLAGTRAHGLGADVDADRRAELESDPKEIFEHATSVKLAYGEVSQVCEPVSVAITDFMTVARRGSVQHLLHHPGVLPGAGVQPDRLHRGRLLPHR
nr:chorismate-binding protein [Protofrankia symbiont of Coriaria ruscifolia]